MYISISFAFLLLFTFSFAAIEEAIEEGIEETIEGNVGRLYIVPAPVKDGGKFPLRWVELNSEVHEEVITINLGDQWVLPAGLQRLSDIKVRAFAFVSAMTTAGARSFELSAHGTVLRKNKWSFLSEPKPEAIQITSGVCKANKEDTKEKKVIYYVWRKDGSRKAGNIRHLPDLNKIEPFTLDTITVKEIIKPRKQEAPAPPPTKGEDPGDIRWTDFGGARVGDKRQT